MARSNPAKLKRGLYRLRPLSSRRLERLDALDSQVWALSTILANRQADPRGQLLAGHEWLDVEEVLYWIDVIRLLHEGLNPEDIVERETDDEYFFVAKTGTCSFGATAEAMRAHYKYFAKRATLREWIAVKKLHDERALACAVVRWRLKGRTATQIAKVEVPKGFPEQYPKGLSNEKIRGILEYFHLSTQGFRVSWQTYIACDIKKLNLDRVLMAHVIKQGGYLPPLSTKNCSKKRSEIRERIVAANPKITTELNIREIQRLWRAEVKEWVFNASPLARTSRDARKAWSKKMDEWLEHPDYTTILGGQLLDDLALRGFHQVLGGHSWLDALAWSLTERVDYFWKHPEIREEIGGGMWRYVYRQWDWAWKHWIKALRMHHGDGKPSSSDNTSK